MSSLNELTKPVSFKVRLIWVAIILGILGYTTYAAVAAFSQMATQLETRYPLQGVE